MRRKLLTLSLLAASFVLSIGLAWAGVRIQPPPIPARVGLSDVVFIGRVESMEPMDVDAKAFPNAKETMKYRIAVVKINQGIHGLKDEKSVRVGFIPVTKPGPIGRFNPKLEVGQEGLFMISKHADGKFFAAPINGYFISLQQKNYEDDLKTVKKAVDVLKDTKGALQSKDADERLIAATIVVSKYRTQKPPFANKEEPIDAEESKLILNAIANAKWQAFKFGEMNPQTLFFQLGINDKDGWKAPAQATPENMRDGVQAWVRDHGDYRIKRFVAGAESK
jgi:hypothetical protein